MAEKKEEKKAAQQPLPEGEKPEYERHGMTKEQWEQLQGADPSDSQMPPVDMPKEDVPRDDYDNPYPGMKPAENAHQNKNLPAKAEDVRFQVSRLYGVPSTFLIMMGAPGKEQPFVTSAGLAIKADKKGVRAIQSDNIEEVKDDKGVFAGYRCTAYLWPKITEDDKEVLKLVAGLDKEVQKEMLKNLLVPFTAVGTATKTNTNVKMGMDKYMVELAQTRAINRAKRQFTAMGLTSIEEMPEYQGEESGDK